MGSLYDLFQKRLIKTGSAYPGMACRLVAENLPSYLSSATSSYLVLAGFARLSPAMNAIYQYLKSQEQAFLYLDVDQYYMQAEIPHKAGQWFMTLQEPISWVSDALQHLPKKAEIIGTPLRVGQAKAIGELLSQKFADEGWEPEDTAIILPEESLLFSVLNAIPKSVKSVNVTLGYPLYNVPLYALFEQLVEFQLAKKLEQDTWYYKISPFAALLNNPEITTETARKWLEALSQHHRRQFLWVNPLELEPKEEELLNITRPIKTVNELIQYFREVLDFLNAKTHINPFDREYIYYYHTYLTRLENLMLSYELLEPEALLTDTASIKIFWQLFRKILLQEKINFTGEPIQGLQILSISQSIALDYKNILVASMNEGIYPPPAPTSYIPQKLREAWKLPNFKTHDADAAYLFYRILHKAENIHLFYNDTEGVGASGTEQSRFLQQLAYEQPFLKGSLTRYSRYMPVLPKRTRKSICIPKDEYVHALLRKYYQPTQEASRKTLTPTAITTYFTCRLKFYFKYLAELAESSQISPEKDNTLFGNLFHDTLEKLYQASSGMQAGFHKPDDFNNLLNTVASNVESIFQEKVFYPEPLTGQMYLELQAVIQMITMLIDAEKERVPFLILALEQTYQRELTFSRETILLEGRIDRIDRKDGCIEILDYKTSNSDNLKKTLVKISARDTIEETIKLIFQENKHTTIQGLLYAYLFNAEDNSPISIGFYYLCKEKKKFTINHILQENEDYHLIMETFEKYLKAYLHELFFESAPFSQTEDKHNCEYCPYQSFCYIEPI